MNNTKRRDGLTDLVCERNRHFRLFEKEIDRLTKALRDIEMETREGGQWTIRDINEAARAALAKAGV